MFSIQALYKGNFEIIFYADNPYTNNEEDYLKLSVWSFRGKTKSILNNYLRDMTANYKTSFLLPHDYEITTFNYPQYVLPPVPYNYQPYTKDIWDANAIQPLKTKITAPAQCKGAFPPPVNNLFSDEFYDAYYDVEIDLKQNDPTIQSISKFQDAYKTIEISNLNNIQIECCQPDIENFIPNINIDIKGGGNNCSSSHGLLSQMTLQESGHSQVDKVNFPNIFTIDTKEITNDIQTIEPIAYTTGLLTNKNYKNKYKLYSAHWYCEFVLQITKLFNDDNNKIKEKYI